MSFVDISVKWKLFLIAIVSVLAFGIYLAFNLWINDKNSLLLTSLRSYSFPLLEKSTKVNVTLERLAEQLNNAVQTREEKFLESAAKTARNIELDIAKIYELESIRKSDALELQTLFKDYYAKADGLAREMFSDDIDFSTFPQKIAEKEKVNEELNMKLKVFIEYAHGNFSNMIDTANENAVLSLQMGGVIRLVSILLLTVTVFAIARLILSNISNVSESLKEIAQGGSDFSKEIRVRSRDEIGLLAINFNALMAKLKEKANDLTSMMQNMHQGLFTITSDQTIHKEYSAFIEQIFETKDIGGRNYFDLLFSRTSLTADALDQTNTAVSALLGEEQMMYDFNSHLLATEFDATFEDGQVKKIELDWDPIVSEDGIITKLMVTARDVTELKKMQAEAEEQKKELAMIGDILRITPAKFDNFLANSYHLLSQNRNLISNFTEKNLDTINKLFVNMHTIKGAARTFKLDDVTSLVHEAETEYDLLRKQEDYPLDNVRLEIQLRLVYDALKKYEALKNEKLSFTSDTAGEVSGIDEEKLVDILQRLKRLDGAQAGELYEIIDMLDEMTRKELWLAIEDTVKSLPELAESLGKSKPSLHVDLDGYSVPKACLPVFNNVFTHLLRNSIDHGLETSEQRIKKGKPESGNIYISLLDEAGAKFLSVKDDGAGLNLAKLKEKAISNSVSNSLIETEEDVANLMFMPGLSTAESLSDISGRGVGMDAVKTFLNNIGCDIKVSLMGNSKAGYAPFEFRIRLPDQDAYNV